MSVLQPHLSAIKKIHWPAWTPDVIGIVLFVLLFLVFPKSGLGLQSMTAWHDQALYLKALNEILSQGSSQLIPEGWVGPGYISIAVLIVKVMGLSPTQSLLVMAQAGFLSTGLLLQLYVRRLAAQLSTSRRLVLSVMSAVVLFTSIWAASSDIPLTHFLEVPLLTALVVLLNRRITWLTSLAIGATVVFIYQTRAFEGDVTLIALATAGAIAILGGVQRRQDWPRLPQVVATTTFFAGGAAISSVIIYITTGYALPFAQYNNDIAMALTPELLPYKFVQLFVNTCFMTVCKFTQSLPTDIFDTDLIGWRAPISLQLPSLLAVLVAIVCILVASRPARFALFKFTNLVPILIAGGLVLAYTSGAPSGAPQLRYGFMREYCGPMVLSFMVMCSLYATASVDVKSARLSQTGVILGAFCVVCLMLLRLISPSFLESGSLSNIAYSPICSAQSCTFALEARDRAGAPVAIPGSTIYFENCKGGVRQGIADVREIEYSKSDCQGVTLISTVSGFAETPDVAAAIKQPFAGSEGSCNADHSAMKVQLGATIPFNSANLDQLTCLTGEGWSDPESWGTWTDASSADLHIDLGEQSPGDLTLLMNARAFSRGDTQDIVVQSNGQDIGHLAVATGDLSDYALKIPKAAIKAGRLDLTLQIGSPASPRSMGRGSDERVLGLGLSSMRLTAG